MRFTCYSFGSIRVDGMTYDHDLVIDRGKASSPPARQAPAAVHRRPDG